ncbi:O-methyltransferase, family 3 [Pseudonocardia sp. N23]|nr:O-methyltransferase, family 3 [Pseudonocardia sp. N23]
MAGLGPALAFLAATVSARAVVEVGTGTGWGGLWLLRGMAPDGVLTSIDVDPEQQRATRRTFLDAGHGPSRLRLIVGLAGEVLPRLTDGGYDLVVVDGVRTEYPSHLVEAIRLLRPGGVLALHGVQEQPTGDGPEVVAVRATLDMVREDPRLAPVLLPLGAGLLCASRRA